ncbi:MAG: DNA-directed RNA polymerase, subunit E'' [Desulfurococcales archaeon]|nr:DNA-directed RNA polymerase, subunit E'' [Desulfurococcales archaeon]
MSARRSRKAPFKACTKCKALVPHEVTKCPICGNESFTENWSGVIIVLDPENSKIAKSLGIKKKGKYAIRLGA